MSEFLDSVQKASDLRDHDRTLEAVRGVFYALFLGGEADRAREAAKHLPEELEALWKPALFARLREEDGAGGSFGDDDFVARVLRRAPELDGVGVERVARAVLRELEPHLSAEGRSELAPALPDHLRDDWDRPG